MHAEEKSCEIYILCASLQFTFSFLDPLASGTACAWDHVRHVTGKLDKRCSSSLKHSLLHILAALLLLVVVLMPVQDRTNEFRSCVESIRSRSSIPARGSEAKQKLLQPNGKAGSSKSEFSRMASAIGKDISSATIKLSKLAQREYFFVCRTTHTYGSQWRNVKPYLMTVLWRLA